MTDAGLERALDQLGDGGGPPADWQDRVAARITEPPAPRRARWPFMVAGSGLLAAAAAVVLFVALRAPDTPPPEDETPAGRADTMVEELEHTADRIEVQTDEAYQDLLAARTDAERLALEQVLKETLRELDAVKRQLKKARMKWPRLDDGKISVKCEPNDPLCGVN